MTMASLISKRMADGARDLQQGMTSPALPQARESVGSAARLEERGAEGQTSASVPRQGPPPPPVLERLLLERLGAALVAEWNNLSVSLQRAVYERSVDGSTSLNRLTMRRQMARFLHDRK
jgi:hypothetical protein